MGQNAFLGLTPLLSNLISQTSYIPSLSDIAQHVLSFLSHTFDDYKQLVGQTAVFEVAIFGYCPKENELSAFHFTPKEVDGIIQMTLAAHKGMKDKEFVYLGDDKKTMCLDIAAAFAGDSIPGRPLSRMPRYIIQNRIDDDAYVSIGGDIQLGIADKFGFRPLTLCKPRVRGQPAAYMSYLGRELTADIAYVGEAMVGMPGMA